jgi:hypothetical protein
MPVLLASVGGDARRSRALRPAYKARLLAAARSVTVRNPQDADLLLDGRLPARYFPDIAWGTAAAFPVARRRGPRPRIGIDLYSSNLIRQGAVHLLPLLQAAARMRSDCDFVCIDTTNAARRPYRGLGRLLRGGNVGAYQFRDLETDLAFVASLDALVSSRFHLPVVAMQYGVPTLSVIPEPKTRLLFANLGLEGLVFGRRRLPELARLLGDPGALERLTRASPGPDVAALSAASRGHIDAVRGSLAGLAAGAARGQNGTPDRG